MTSQQIKEKLENLDVAALMNTSTGDFVSYMVNDAKIFKSERDVRCFVLQYLSKAVVEDEAELPITYYAENEEMPEEDKVVDTSGIEMMSQELINKMTDK